MTIVIKVLKDAIITADDVSLDIQKKISVLQEDLAVISKERTGLVNALQSNCKHPSSHRVDGMYMSGGYDHVSELPYTIVCDVCSKVLESRLIRGTYA